MGKVITITIEVNRGFRCINPELKEFKDTSLELKGVARTGWTQTNSPGSNGKKTNIPPSINLFQECWYTTVVRGALRRLNRLKKYRMLQFRMLREAVKQNNELPRV